MNRAVKVASTRVLRSPSLKLQIHCWREAVALIDRASAKLQIKRVQ